MSEPFIAEIRMWGLNFAPRGWAFCDGQLLQISQNTALFSLVGTTYGGDGRTTFGLPNLKGRVAMHSGNGPGLTQRRLGQQGGADSVGLTVPQVGSHAHVARGVDEDASSADPTGDYFAITDGDAYKGTGTEVTMNANTIGLAGDGILHNNLQPYLGIHFCIALQGVYPSHS